MSDVDLRKLFEKDVEGEKEKFSQLIFKKGYNEVNTAELHGLVEQIMEGLFMFRKSCPSNFVNMVNFCMNHHETSYLDKNNLKISLEIFDFDVNKMNNRSLIVEQDVILENCLPLEGVLGEKEANCYDRFHSFERILY